MFQSMIRISILLFGRAREIAGRQTLELNLEGDPTVGSAFDVLKADYPKLGEMERSLLLAVNESYADRSQKLEDGDRLAVLPPVSGGETDVDDSGDFFQVTLEPIDIAGLRARLLAGESGAVVVFDGVARNNSKGRRTLYLEYEGYTEMALNTFRQIAGEVHEQWPISRIGIIHRLGRIEISESSVVIVTTSPHRKQAFEACRYAIDRLKQVAPIWKKEYFEDGAVWVEGECTRDPERF
jgi:MoaE-MoaD fusion protein